MRMRQLLLTAAAAALAACSTSAPDEVVQGVAVYTQPAPGLDIASLGPSPTFFLDPSVTIRSNGQDQAPGSITDAVFQPVATAIVRDMEAAGYTQSTTVNGATVGLQLGVAKATQDYYYSGGWCDIYYGWYGCYYPPVYAGSYSYGVGILAMVDLTAQPAAGQPFPNLWGAFIYGVSTGATNSSRLASGVDRAFSQSPYLAVP